MLAVDPSQTDVSAETQLAAILRGEALAPAELAALDYELLIQSAIDHGVAPLLHHMLAGSDSWADYPERFRDLLTRPAQHAIAQDLWRISDLGHLLDQFSSEGIPKLLMKGTGLAYTHYERPQLRERCDIDILFPDTETFDRAWSIMEPLGYIRENTLSGGFVGYQYCCHRPLGSLFMQVLDCHTRVNDYEFFANALNFEELLEQSVALPDIGPSARTLGAVHALLLACMHRVATLPRGDAGRLIWLYDIQLLAASLSTEEWSQLLALARDRQICGSAVHSMRAARAHFPFEVPPEVWSALKEAAEHEPFTPGEEMKRWRYYFQVFKSVPGPGGKARLLREHFFPPADYMLQKYQTRNRLVLPYLYVHRVLSGLKRYF